MRSRVGATIAIAVGAVVLLAAPAFAHITVDPGQATKGGSTKLTFRVPNEEDAANTVEFDVSFDQAHPIATVDVEPKPGWTVKVDKKPLATPLQTDDGQVTEAVSEISWTGGTIAPGQFDEFAVSIGPLPSDTDHLAFPAVQTYSDGTQVSWIQQTIAGQPEPDRPAPSLTLVDAPGESTSSTAGAPSTASNTASSSSSVSSKPSDSNGLAIAALLVGCVGVGLGGWAAWKARRSA